MSKHKVKVVKMALNLCMLIFSIMLLHPFCESMAIDSEETILLTIGQQRTVDTPGLNRIAVGDPNVADVKALESSEQVLITAKDIGRTNLIIWNSDNKQIVIPVEVIGYNPQEIAEEVKKLLGNIEGIAVRTVGQRVVIEGYVLKNQDLEKIVKIASLYPQVMNLATINPVVIDMYITHINNEFVSHGWKNAKAKKMSKMIVLEGDVINESDKNTAEAIAKAYYDNVVNFLKIGVEIHKLINISVDFIELADDDRQKVGINWGDALSIGARVGAGGSFGGGDNSFSGSYGVVANYGLTIDMIKGKVNSRVLAQPKLLCRSGENADFLAGGEVAIPLITQNSSTVEYKDYGMILKISPVADDSGNIETKIEIENSNVSSVSQSGIPSFRTSRVSTFVNGKDNQTIVLSGIVNHNQAKGVEKIPLLGEIPILGELFKSRAFQEQKSELLIFVTPTIVQMNNNTMAAEAKNMRNNFSEKEKDLKFKLLD